MRKISYYRDLVLVLTQKEMKVRYKNHVLGYLWSIINPLAFAFVFYIAFKVVMRLNMKDYALFLISGLFPWQWFANSVTVAPAAFIANSSIIKKVNFPKSAITLSIAIHDMIHFVLSVPVIVLFLFLYGRSPSLSWIYGLPLLLFIQLLFVYGLTLMLSSINLFFRDLERLIIILTTLLFYFTPVIYPDSMVPERYRFLMNLNPLAPLMISWRRLFLEGAVDPAMIVLSFFYGIVMCLIGFSIYKRLYWKFAEVL